MKSDYTGNIAGVDTSYDISHPYYGFHLGLGRVTKLKGGASVDTYLKYFYAHQNDADATLATGETYKFDDVDSSRLRLGVRYTKGDSPESQVYAGIAWEYEFDGDARASYQGMDTPSPSLKGSSGVLELGARFAPKDSNVSYELNLNGWAGKRRGVSGGVSVNWTF
ncbi:autotransporter outer membrane beta-barrel domain-containing protein [Selenomonas sputigena]|uniref:Autotransporter outer membrane beta-barrel domain-containing protein n=1 Tax=Selenomonas sputigena TaxID=69823 RepID=A0ABV3X6H2_9FIRM